MKRVPRRILTGTLSTMQNIVFAQESPIGTCKLIFEMQSTKVLEGGTDARVVQLVIEQTNAQGIKLLQLNLVGLLCPISIL